MPKRKLIKKAHISKALILQKDLLVDNMKYVLATNKHRH